MTATVHPIIYPTWMRSQSPLAIYYSSGLLQRWRHIGDVGFFVAVGEYQKHDREAQDGWEQQRLLSTIPVFHLVLFD